MSNQNQYPPPGYPYGYPQQPQQPQPQYYGQAYGVAPQPTFYPPVQQPPWAGYTQGYQPPHPQGYQPAPPMQPPPPQQVPAAGGFFMPDQSLIESSYRRAAELQEQAARARAGIGGGGGYTFFKIPGPKGEEKWGASVPTGYEAARPFRALPAWREQTLHFVEAAKHFWKSQQRPQGASLWCPGENVCKICIARQKAFDGGVERLIELARSWGKPRRHFMYQGFAIDDPQSHFDPEGGVMRPQILDAGATMHNLIVELQKTRGFSNIFHPVYGRNLSIKKKKTGHEDMDIEYHVLDMEPSAIPPEFHPEALNLWDLTRLVKLPTEAEQLNAVAEMGLDATGAPMSYSPNPNPPHPNPYASQAPQTPQSVPWQQPGSGWPAQLPSMGGAPQAPVPVPVPQQAPATQYAPQPSRAAGPQPPGPPPPVSGPPGPPPPNMSAPPPYASPPPPNMSAPPSYVNPELAAFEAQLRGQAPDGANANANAKTTDVPF